MKQILCGSWRWTRLLILGVMLTGCGTAIDDDTQAWGTEAVRYFDKLAMEYSANDYYGVLDFYSQDAFVEKVRGDISGGALVRNLLLWNSGDLDHEILGLHLGADGAITLVRWAAAEELSAVLSLVDSGSITGETVFDYGLSLQQGLRATPEMLAKYTTLYQDYAEAWPDGSDSDFARLYAAEAQIEDSVGGLNVEGLSAIRGTRGRSDIDVASAAEVGRNTDEQSVAVYLGPAGYGQDPQRAVGVFHLEDPTGCVSQLAVAWEVADGKIVRERRYHEVESFARCTASPPDGWWTGLTFPPPSDEVVSNVIRTEGGSEIRIHNGTPRLENLVISAMERFALGGLAEPRFSSVTFEPSRSCEDRSGRLLQTNGERSLFLCLYEEDLCRGSEACSEPALSVRNSVLHELAHAWQIDHMDEGIQERFMNLVGLAVWQDNDVGWSDRGVEYSAEVIAWGLLEEEAPMVRIGAPPCQDLFAAYLVLTGISPLRDVGQCPAASSG